MVKLTKEEKQILIEFGKVGRRLDRKKRWTNKMVEVILPIYKNPLFKDYLSMYNEYHKRLVKRAKWYEEYIDSDNETIETYNKMILDLNKKKDKSELEIREINRYKEKIKDINKRLKNKKDDMNYYNNSTLLPKIKDINKIKKLQPRMYSEMLRIFTDSFKDTYIDRKKQEFIKSTPIYDKYIRPKLEEVLTSWKKDLKKEVYDAMLRQVKNFIHWNHIGSKITYDNVYTEYIDIDTKYSGYGERKITRIGEIKLDKIKKYADNVVENNINSFVEKMAIKLQWLDKKPTQFTLESGTLKGMLCCDFTLIYPNKKMVISTTYETAISSKGNPFIRFPTRFYYNGTMKSVLWMSKNFF